MTHVDLVADSNVVSYIYRRGPLGRAYSDLIGVSRTGITFLSVAESRAGAVYGNWSARQIAALDAFLSRFFLLPASPEVANICGAILGRCKQIGIAMTWPDALSAATALWLDVPLVTHDRDLEGIPDLRVLTAHQEWRVGEEGSGLGMGAPLWLGERDAWRSHTQMN